LTFNETQNQLNAWMKTLNEGPQQNNSWKDCIKPTKTSIILSTGICIVGYIMYKLITII